MTTTKSFNFSGTNITMIATPVKEDTDASYMEMLDEFICDQLDEFICDQKEKCSNDLSCIGCYPQEEKSKVVFEMGGEPIKKLKMPYTTMKDWMIEEGWKFVDDEDGNTTAIFE